MFLDDLNKASDGPSADLIRQLQAQGLPVPATTRLFAYKHARTKFLSQYTHEVMRGPSPLSAGQRELIAAFVSRRNECRY